MRLLSWSSNSTWRGWRGPGQICKHTLAGCMGLKYATPPMSSQVGRVQIFSPLCQRCRVVWTTASAAQPILAGSNSRGSACGIAGALCCLLMWRPMKLGRTITSTRAPWTYCWWPPMRISRWQQTSCPKISMDYSSDAQQVTLGSWAWGKCSTSGGPGSGAWVAARSSRPTSSRDSSLGLPGGDPGQPGDVKGQGLIGHYAGGLKGRMQAYCNLAPPALSAETLQGACVGRAAWGCVVPASPGGSHVNFVEDVGRCSPKVDILTEEESLGSPQHLFALRALAILLGCSAMASGGKGNYAAQAAASSSSGGALHRDGERPALWWWSLHNGHVNGGRLRAS